MARITDLRHINRATMTVALNDAEGTIVHVGTPTVALVDELRGGAEALFDVLEGRNGNAAAKKAVYDFAAKVINCNDDLFTVTGEELATTYGLSLTALGVFFNDYTEFLTSIQKEKN